MYKANKGDVVVVVVVVVVVRKLLLRPRPILGFISLCLRVSVFLNATRGDGNCPTLASKRK